ncbi:MAG: hypothetical protein ACI9J2_002373 [Saprospiraceae bacterium]|jgi:hypothetical protein
MSSPLARKSSATGLLSDKLETPKPNGFVTNSYSSLVKLRTYCVNDRNTTVIDGEALVKFA